MNSVVAMIVDEPEYYRYSSARDYAGERGLLDVISAE
jgi:putative transposase